MGGVDLLAGASRVGLALIFNCLWQGALIAGVAWVTLRIFSGANATTRYAVWTLTLIAMLVVPVVTSLSRISFERAAQVQTSAPSRAVVRTVAAPAKVPKA